MSLPYFPFYPSDFEAKTSHLTLEEDGAYNRLLRLMWMTPGCSLPDDPAWIARRLRVDAATYDRVVAPIISEFFKRARKRIYSPRLSREYESAKVTHELRVSSGKKGGRPAKSLKSDTPEESRAKAGPKQPEPEPEPEEERRTEAKASVVVLAKTDDHSQACADHFNAVAARVGWPQVQRLTPARKAALAQRISDIGGEEAWRDAIDRAAMSPLLTGQTGRGWRADFDWLCKAANFTKLMEGNYDPRDHEPLGRPPHQRGSGGPLDSMVAAFASVANRQPN